MKIEHGATFDKLDMIIQRKKGHNERHLLCPGIYYSLILAIIPAIREATS
jgi:hypothetical protein